MIALAPIIDILTGGWKKYALAAVGVVGLVTATYIFYLRGELAQMALDLAVERAAFAECQRVNKANKDAVEKIERDTRVAIDELTAKLQRKTEEKDRVKVIREIVREKAKECSGVDPATRAVIDGLRGSGANADRNKVRPPGNSARTP